MAEAMATELMVEAYWSLQKYWTFVRYPYRKPNPAKEGRRGGWSDVDVLAYSSKDKHLVLAEVKAQGKKDVVYVYTGKNETQAICDWATADSSDWFAFISNAHYVIEEFQKTGLKGDQTDIEKVTLLLVSNSYMPADIDYAKAMESRADMAGLGQLKIRDICFQMKSGADIMAELMDLVHRDLQGRRYGHPILDFVRELCRYYHPHLSGAGSKGKRISSSDSKLREDIAKLLVDAIGQLRQGK